MSPTRAILVLPLALSCAGAARAPRAASSISTPPGGPAAARAAEAPAGPRVPVEVVAHCVLPQPPPGDRLREERGLVYSRPGGTPLRLDLVRPAARGPFPVVLLVHGGGWHAGGRSDLDRSARRLATRGYAVANVDYRLVPQVFPAAVADVRCALRWLRHHAAEHDLDPERIGAVGFSAGAHLVSLAGVAPELAGLDDACGETASPRLAAVVAYFGPSDLRATAGWPRASARVIDRFLGVPAADDPTRAALASPIVHVDASDPPFLLVQGLADRTVPADQSTRFRDVLEAAGVAVTYVGVRGASHGFGLFSARGGLRAAPCTMLAFLRAHLRPVPPRLSVPESGRSD